MKTLKIQIRKDGITYYEKGNKFCQLMPAAIKELFEELLPGIEFKWQSEFNNNNFFIVPCVGINKGEAFDAAHWQDGWDNLQKLEISIQNTINQISKWYYNLPVLEGEITLS